MGNEMQDVENFLAGKTDEVERVVFSTAAEYMIHYFQCKKEGRRFVMKEISAAIAEREGVKPESINKRILDCSIAIFGKEGRPAPKRCIVRLAREYNNAKEK